MKNLWCWSLQLPYFSPLVAPSATLAHMGQVWVARSAYFNWPGKYLLFHTPWRSMTWHMVKSHCTCSCLLDAFLRNELWYSIRAWENTFSWNTWLNPLDLPQLVVAAFCTGWYGWHSFSREAQAGRTKMGSQQRIDT